jgi:hypothetical protein
VTGVRPALTEMGLIVAETTIPNSMPVAEMYGDGRAAASPHTGG